MVQTAPILRAITSLGDLQEQFNLAPTNDSEFFTEWFQELPELTDAEKATLDRLKHRFTRHHNYGKVAEGVVNLLLVSPLLELAGFYDEPFLITTEPQVEILLENEDELLRGRIDTLVVQNQLWVLVVESNVRFPLRQPFPKL